MQLKNRTSYVLDRMIVLDKEGAEQLVVICKATFTMGPGGRLQLLDPQPPLQWTDEFVGEPGVSSIRVASEASPPKPGTEVTLTGFARAREPNTRVVDVHLRVGPISKHVRVTGPRRWRRFLWWWWATKPEPFGKIPLTWENAYGGTDKTSDQEAHHAWEPKNPVGRGFAAKGSKVAWAEQLLPFLEDPEHPLKRPGLGGVPACFAPIGRHWAPRVSYAGTYDETWQKERIPLLPEDFDDRFYFSAPADLIVPEGLRGNERVEIAGVSKTEERISFRLPELRPKVSVRLRSRWDFPTMRLDTVAIDAEGRTLTLLVRGQVRVHGEVPGIREIKLEDELFPEGGEPHASPPETSPSSGEPPSFVPDLGDDSLILGRRSRG